MGPTLAVLARRALDAVPAVTGGGACLVRQLGRGVAAALRGEYGRLRSCHRERCERSSAEAREHADPAPTAVIAEITSAPADGLTSGPLAD